MSDRRIDVMGTAMYIVLAMLAGALTPRLAHLARWPRRARGTALLAYWLWCSAWIYVMRFVVVANFREGFELHHRVTADLQAELGRDPTAEEVSARFTARWAEAKGIDP